MVNMNQIGFESENVVRAITVRKYFDVGQLLKLFNGCTRPGENTKPKIRQSLCDLKYVLQPTAGFKGIGDQRYSQFRIIKFAM